MASGKRAGAALVAALVILLGLTSLPATAGHNADDHSDNVELLAERAIIVSPDDPDTEENEEVKALGSDLAFQGNLLVAGSYEGIGLFKISPKAPYLEQISFLPCSGGQGDVSIWGDLVFMSVDSPQAAPECAPPPGTAANPAQYGTGSGYEGLRIISIKNLKRPEQIAFLDTPCGSHTHTIVPAGRKLVVYVESYPLSGQGTDCNYGTHRKVSVAEVPLATPE